MQWNKDSVQQLSNNNEILQMILHRKKKWLRVHNHIKWPINKIVVSGTMMRTLISFEDGFNYLYDKHFRKIDSNTILLSRFVWNSICTLPKTSSVPNFILFIFQYWCGNEFFRWAINLDLYISCMKELCISRFSLYDIMIT